MAIARDRFWLFGARAHQDDRFLGKSEEERFTVWSRITPAEGAFMLDVPNMIMINCDGVPVPFSDDARGYAESFVRMDSVLWGSTGSAGFRVGNEEQFICRLAELYPNIKGAFMDDFFGKFKNNRDAASEAGAMLRGIRNELDKACRPMELYVVWYASQFDTVALPLFDYIDGITLWTWNYKELPMLPERYARIEELFPKHKKLLGVYMYAFPEGIPVPDDMMELQCEFGLSMMKQGRLDGMIFEANTVMGVGLPSEKWLREWIGRVKYDEVPG